MCLSPADIERPVFLSAVSCLSLTAPSLTALTALTRVSNAAGHCHDAGPHCPLTGGGGVLQILS